MWIIELLKILVLEGCELGYANLESKVGRGDRNLWSRRDTLRYRFANIANLSYEPYMSVDIPTS